MGGLRDSFKKYFIFTYVYKSVCLQILMEAKNKPQISCNWSSKWLWELNSVPLEGYPVLSNPVSHKDGDMHSMCSEEMRGQFPLLVLRQLPLLRQAL